MRSCLHHPVSTFAFFVLFFSPFTLSGEDQPAKTAETTESPKSSTHLGIAKIYEENGQLGKAESEYVLSATLDTPEVRSEALDKLRHLLGAENVPELEIARLYEGLGRWPDAEAHFLKASESAATEPERISALEGLRRANRESDSWIGRKIETTEWIAKTGTLALRLVAPILVLFTLIRFFKALRTVSRSTRICLFDGDEEVAKLVQSAFPAVRAKVSKTFSGSPVIRDPQTVSNVYPFVPLNLGDYLPDESIEIGELKIASVASLVHLFVSPRLEIEGGVFPAQSGSFVYAQVWRNKWFQTNLQTVVTANIPNDDPNHEKLETFVYDVYSKTSDTLD
jgi:hypothetical protein